MTDYQRDRGLGQSMGWVGWVGSKKLEFAWVGLG